MQTKTKPLGSSLFPLSAGSGTKREEVWVGTFGSRCLEMVSRMAKRGSRYRVNHHSIHAGIEIGKDYAEKAEHGLKAARGIAAHLAFRKYNWIRNVPIRNVSGNLRGMVVSKRYATVFHFAEDLLKPVEKVVLFVTLADNMAKAYDQTHAIWNSTDSLDVKAARLSTQVSSVLIRTLDGPIRDGAHLAAMSLEGYCQIAGLAGSQRAIGLDEKLKSLDATVTSTIEKVTDGGNMNIFINKYLVFTSPDFLGLKNGPGSPGPSSANAAFGRTTAGSR